MNNGLFIENVHVVKGLDDSADVFNTGPKTVVVNMRLVQKAVFMFRVKGGTTGQGNFKVAAVSTLTGVDVTNVAFKYSKRTSNETQSAVGTAVAADGVTTVAAEAATYLIEVDARSLPEGKDYCYLQTTEVVNDPISGGCDILLLDSRFGYPFPAAVV